ncbi:MAG: hypothetical protein IMZ53_07970 [Thermoplasmata archaeon]|nr:hypothetical protein [Thermoplasmata archaeon]MBE3140503.1 hypothetical protein [Thermoplasmata archaeon]
MDITQSLFPVLYVFLIIITIVLVIVLSLWRYRTIKRLMENQAMKRSGTVVGTFLLPLLKFSYRALPVLVTSVPGSKYRHAKTEVSVTLLKSVPRNLTILKESVATRLGKAWGAADVQVESDEFDRDFLIKTEDEAFARNVVNFTLQNKLLEMKQEKPRIVLEGTWLTVQVPRVVKTEEGYDQLIDLAFALVDRIQEL